MAAQFCNFDIPDIYFGFWKVDGVQDRVIGGVSKILGLEIDGAVNQEDTSGGNSLTKAHQESPSREPHEG